jgi:hypothetical protein
VTAVHDKHVLTTGGASGAPATSMVWFPFLLPVLKEQDLADRDA